MTALLKRRFAISARQRWSQIAIASTLLVLASCPSGGGGGGGGGGVPASTTGPTLSTVESPTTETEVMLRGKALRPGSRLRIEGGADVIIAETPGNKKDFEVIVPLQLDRRNLLYVTELFVAGGESPAATIEVIQDGTAPTLYFDYPSDQQVLYSSEVNVSGRVGDSLSGFMGIEVEVNGQRATVVTGIGTNGTFDLQDFELVEGETVDIVAVAMDLAGNETTRTIQVSYEVPTGNRILPVAGNNQEGSVNELLEDALEVQVLRPDGSPFAGKVVTFEATRSDGRLSGNAGEAGTIRTTVMTGSDGFARAYLRLGSDAGCGNNRVRAESRDVNGAVDFFASATGGDPDQINIGSGGEQVGAVTGPAPQPLSAWVSDGCNGVAGVAVTFTVVDGGGTISGGGDYNREVVIVETGATGHAQATLILGDEPGNNVVLATIEDGSSAGAQFIVIGCAENDSAMKSEDGGSSVGLSVTSLSGQVLDNAQRPIEAVICTLTVGNSDPIETTTSADGIFIFHDIQDSGLAGLSLDGSMAIIPFGAGMRVPNLHYEPFILPNVDNVLTRPVLLPLLNATNDVHYDGTEDVVLTVDGIAGLEMRVKAGSVVLADGTVPSPSDPTSLSLNQVHSDDIPMRPGDGAAPPFSWTLQPGGARFDPPVEITYPNMSGLPAGAASWFLSFDHDTGQFEIVASGAVSSDGSTIRTAPGEGLTVAGWGCNCPPYAVTADCEKCNVTVSGPAAVCAGQTVVYTATAVGAGSINWTASGAGGSPASGSGNSFSVSFASAGTATVTANLTCSGGELTDIHGLTVVVTDGPCGPNVAVPITYDLTTNTLPASMSVNATTVIDRTVQSFRALACADADAGVWRLRVTSVTSPGTINIVPTPVANTPNPATGGNIVNSSGSTGHYCDVIADLANYNAAVGGGKGPGWHVTQSTIDHEDYHWHTEWKTSFNGRWTAPGGEAAMEALTVPMSAHESCESALAALMTQANTTFTQIVTGAVTDYMALGDSPGDPPYAAGQVALDAMVTAIEAYATGQSWPNCP